MSSSPHNWSRKRPAEDDLEDISDQERKDESSWKVKTLDEILQEKRKRLEDETGGKEEKEVTDEREESQPASRNSSATASPGSLKREKIAPNQLESPAAEVIYHLSPGQHSCSSLSSGGATPGNSKALSSHDVSQDKSHQRLKRGQTEEEEGEIVSDGSDHEDETKSKSKGIRKASVSNIEVKDPESTEKEKQGASEKVDSDNDTDDDEDSDDDDESSDNESEEKEDLPSAQKSQQDVIQNRSEKDQNGESEESDESDSESDDESEAESSEEEEEDEASLETKNNKERVIEKVGKKDENDDDDDDDDDDSDEEDEDEDDDDSDEQSESEDDSSEESESENEQVEKQSSVKDPSESGEHVDDEEDEDLHKELVQATESRKQKERAKKQERYATDKPRRERPYSYDDHRTKEYTYSKDSRRHHEREKRQMEERVDKSYLSREKSYEKRDPRYKEKNNEQSSGSRKGMEKSYSKEIDVSKEKLKEKYHTSSRSSKRDSGKSKRKSPRESDSRKDTKLSEKPVKETKNSSDYRRESREDKRRKQHDKQKEIEKSFKGERAAVSKDIGSSILTEHERKQFNQEVVDFESDEGSSTDENAPGSLARGGQHSDVEMLSDKEEEKEPEKPKLPLYLPAIRGCRNVEEFQWLNRIEEGTFGVVYRAKDKRTGEIVALKRLKMEKEKEGFPITSLREINTLLKAQHPNIVTVREIVVGSNMDKIYIVMDYVEHDLKVLMEHMPNPFLAGEVKTLMIQLLRAVAHLHDNWILHRDLKTSNLLLSNKGILKVGDFGLAREYGSPLRHYTPIVVTLWYRAPELLLGVKEYSCPIDLWSVGCIFAELLTMKPLFPGVSEIDQINKIFKELGTPSDKIWPGPPSYSELPAVKKVTFTEYPYNNLRNKFGAYLTDKGFDLLNRFLTYDPKKRVTAEQALEHGFFDESPLPVDPSMFPSWPAKSELVKRPRRKNYEHSPKAPEGGASFAKLGEDDSGGFHIATLKKGASKAPGFSLKF